MYESLPRKYRPQTFQSLVGQEAIATTLKNALKFNRVAHAYLFSGSRGTGKTTVARLFAKALNCRHLTPEFEPCNQCTSCQEITAGRSLDVLEIDGASNRGIDDIRQINETVGYASSSSKYKIYIIDEAHMLTKEAFNALLKTLEEPPANVKFFFATTEAHKMPATIISRCQRFDFNRLSTPEIVEKLRHIANDQKAVIEDEALQLIAHLAEGGLRDAESLFDQLLCYSEGPITYNSVAQAVALSPRSYYFRLDQAIADRNLSFAFELSQEIFSSGKEVSSFLDGLLQHFRTLLLLKLGLPSATYLSESDKQAYMSSEKLYTEEECLYALDYITGWYKELSKIPFKQMMLEMILLHLLRSKQRIPLPTLVRRLIELDQKGPAAPEIPAPAPLQAVQAPKAAAPIEPKTPPIEPIATPPPAAAAPMAHPSRYDTLLRFAAVELEGSVKP